MDRTLFCLLFVTTFICAWVNSAQAGDKMLATGVEDIRVLLFDEYDIDEFLIFAMNGSVFMSNEDGNVITVQEGETGARLASVRRGIRYNRDGRSTTSGEWTISGTGTSLIRFFSPETGWRYYYGVIRVSKDENDNLRFINQVNLEDYVASVVGSEMHFDHPEALKVQAVISRTYALWNISLFQERDYELTDNIMNQVYLGEYISKPRYREAAEATRDQVLMWSDKLIMAVYHSTCGGRTASNTSVWSGNALPYLVGIHDNQSCSASPHYRWDSEVGVANIHRIFKRDRRNPVVRIDVANRDSFERVTHVMIYYRNGVEKLPLNTFRLAVNRRLGNMTIRSAYFDMKVNADSYIFSGRGMGHGVGLCQWGALGLAESGWRYSDILKFYYKGVDITHYNQLHGDGYKLARF